MELHFLGTGAGLPSKLRNVTSLVVDLLAERGTCWMFDCGEGTQQQVLHSHIKLSKLDKLFVTHLHGDHIFGIPGLLSSRSFHGGTTECTIYGPTGIRQYVHQCLLSSSTHLSFPLSIVEIENDGVVFEDDKLKVSAGWLNHRVPCLGYRIEEKPRPGEFFPERAQRLGLSPGPLYAKLQGGEPVATSAGRRVYPEEVMGPSRQGRTLTILGDTRPCDTVLELARGADVLVHEGTFRTSDSELAKAYHHSTTKEAAEAALTSGVRQLILTHVSARYRPEDMDELEAEAKAIFPSSMYASDFLTVPVSQPE